MGKKKKKNRVSKKIDKKVPTISACMMVKNEGELLPQCLERIKDFVDEIIIVDTGSTDRTVEIAKSFGARVYHHPWENDFSKHRNQSISYASYDWILIMDADEAFFPQDAPNIKRIVQETRSDFLYFQCYDLEKTGEVHGVFNQVRLFKNGLGMHYTKNVHNQLQTVGKGEYVRLRFRHYGYDLSPEKMEEKHKRTTILLEEMIATNPEDIYSRYQLAASYSMHKDYDKAVEHGEFALRMRREKGFTDSYFINTYYTVGQGYLALGDLENAERIFLEALDYFDLNLDACYMLANIYFRKRNAAKCKDMSFRYLEILDTLKKNPETMRGVYFCSFADAPKIYFGLGCVAHIENDHEKMDQYFLQSFEMDACKAEGAVLVARFFLEVGLDERCVRWLTAAYRAGSRDKDIIEYLQKISTEFLGEFDRFEMALLKIKLFWRLEQIEELVKCLEQLMISLGMETDLVVNSMADLGALVYDVAEVFCRRRHWHLAEQALSLALQTAPAIFDHNKFDRLLPNTEQRTAPQPS